MQADIRSPGSLKRILNGVDTVIHLGARAAFEPSNAITFGNSSEAQSSSLSSLNMPIKGVMASSDLSCANALQA